MLSAFHCPQLSTSQLFSAPCDYQLLPAFYSQPLPTLNCFSAPCNNSTSVSRKNVFYILQNVKLFSSDVNFFLDFFVFLIFLAEKPLIFPCEPAFFGVAVNIITVLAAFSPD